MNNSPKKIAGFTLIETVIYIALFSLVIGAFVSFVLTISAMRNKQRAVHEVLSNERVLDSLLSLQVKMAGEIISPVAVSTSSSMIFRKRGTTSISRIYVSEGMIYLEEEGGAFPMLSSECVVRDFVFSNAATDSRFAAISAVGHMENRPSSGVDSYFGNDFSFNVWTRF